MLCCRYLFRYFNIARMTGRLGELLLILLIVLVVFGAGKIPRIMGDIGRGIKAFKGGLSDNTPNILNDEKKDNNENK